MLLKLARDVAPYEIYHMVHILMLPWQHARFQSPASSKLNITICDSTRQNTWFYLRCMPVPPSLGLPVKFQKRAKKYIDFNFHIYNKPVEIVQNYTYLGTVISSTGNFSLALDKLKEKALHALFSLRKHTNLSKLSPFLVLGIKFSTQ